MAILSCVLGWFAKFERSSRTLEAIRELKLIRFFLQGIDLTPFTSRRQEAKRKPRIEKFREDGGEEELEDESNDQSNDPGFDHFEPDHLEQHENFSFDHFTNPVKRMKSS